ncbi:murein biosynthesis integral membrane protein MurJ [Gryllotalpicola ginsengisoli]|uniref:murein biosynthesis integral membrane protein MurJ n=1 Tax=Gryllotalpicola ginsengisoli TaxID=444608 RepID=UPI0003B6B7D1|nr:lipid II flippase MurJ [Gryllotalpicola ginsengisoli]
MASIGRATAFLASGTIVSRALGFGRQWLLVQAIGATGFVTDAFNTANSAPNTVYAIISQGILNAVLIPQLVRAAKHSDGGRAYINKLVTLGICVFAFLTVIATLLAPQFMYIFGIRGPETQLAIAFAYWSMPQVFFYGLYSLLGEVLNARKSFGPFTWSPVLNNIVSIASLAVFMWAYGPHTVGDTSAWPPLKIFILAGGATIGIAAQALILFLAWRRVGLSFRLDFRWRGMQLRDVGRAAGWTFAMLVCTQLAGAFETFVANSASGAHRAGSQALSTTWLIFMLPYSIIAVSIVTAYFTRMAEDARDARYDAFKADYSAAVRSNVLLITFCSAVLILTAFSFSRVFTADWFAYGVVLIGFLLGLVPSVVGFVTLRALYSLGDTRSPFFYTLVQSSLVVIGLLICLRLPLDVRVAAIAVTVSIAGSVQASLAMYFLRRRLRGLDIRNIVQTLVRSFIAALISFAVGVVVMLLLSLIDGGRFTVATPLTAIVSMAVAGLIMLAVYIAILRALRTPELADVWAIARARLGRSRVTE